MYNYYASDIIEEVRVSNDIVDVVSEYVRLEKRGKNYFGLCPFHKENTPSFSVEAGKQIFYCFGCGKGGNVFQFIMNVENLEYIEAVRLLADRARIQLPEGENDQEKEKALLKQEIIKINTEAARFFYNNLNSKQFENARLYLKERKVSDHTIRRFGMGYSPEEWDMLYKHLTVKGFKDENILKSGLVISGKNGSCYDRFRGRIMFPIFDIRGNVIGFGGRVTDSSVPKYMNSPETIAYNKSKSLYALNFAKNAGQKRMLIVEGYMDVISLHQCGIINTVASLGTALTESQGRILKKYAEEIVIAYDSDAAGQAAAIRGLDLLNDIGCNVKVLIIPQGKDPDEFIKKNGTEEFNRLVDKSLSLVEYKIKVLKKQIDTESTEGKIKFLNKVSEVLVRIDNSIEREMYIKKLADEYKISEEALQSEIYKKSKPKANLKTVTASIPSEKTSRKNISGKHDNKLVYYERILIALMCIDNSIYKDIKNKITAELFSEPENWQIAKEVSERLQSNKSMVPAELLDILDKEAASVFTKIFQEECNYEDNYKAVLDIIKRIELYKLEKRKQEIFDLLNRKEKIEGDVEKLNQELSSLIIAIRKMKES